MFNIYVLQENIQIIQDCPLYYQIRLLSEIGLLKILIFGTFCCCLLVKQYWGAVRSWFVYGFITCLCNLPFSLAIQTLGCILLHNNPLRKIFWHLSNYICKKIQLMSQVISYKTLHNNYSRPFINVEHFDFCWCLSIVHISYLFLYILFSLHFWTSMVDKWLEPLQYFAQINTMWIISSETSLIFVLICHTVFVYTCTYIIKYTCQMFLLGNNCLQRRYVLTIKRNLQ